MKKPWLYLVLGILTAMAVPPQVRGGPAPPAPEKNDVLLSTMQQELKRAQGELGRLDPAPYFMSFSVYDQTLSLTAASEGSLISSTRQRKRSGDVIMRVGTPALDNAHEENRASAISSGVLPLNDDANAIARVLWQLTYGEYRKASKAYLNIKTTNQVNAKEEDTSPDFSQETSQTHADYKQIGAEIDQAALEDLVRRYSGLFRKYPHVYRSAVVLAIQQTQFHFVSSEGTNVVAPSAVVRLAIEAETRADDGMELMRVETFQAETPNQLPGDKVVTARVEKMASDLKDLRAAPVAEPFDGPALLSGRSAAVFFHEVLGHRLEGHRQRGEREGQTFTKKVNQAVLPQFLSVVDDPTEHVLGGVDLGGWYQYDDEGIPATRVEVIKDGILKNFLMSRAPIKDFGKSNGHGRGQAGLMPTGRQGNLIVTSSNRIKDSELRQGLINEVKKQGKPYGLFFEDIEGGFTLTQRSMPQAFQVLPVMVWRVYADGRPDQLVRGVDIVGTPLAAMNRIVLTGEKTEVFNGICGAESGSVPVAAAAPAMLFSEIEVQKQAHSLNRPPILPPPGFETGEPAAPDKNKAGGQP
jgi:TldD protein